MPPEQPRLDAHSLPRPAPPVALQPPVAETELEWEVRYFVLFDTYRLCHFDDLQDGVPIGDRGLVYLANVRSVEKVRGLPRTAPCTASTRRPRGGQRRPAAVTCMHVHACMCSGRWQQWHGAHRSRRPAARQLSRCACVAPVAGPRRRHLCDEGRVQGVHVQARAARRGVHAHVDLRDHAAGRQGKDPWPRLSLLTRCKQTAQGLGARVVERCPGAGVALHLRLYASARACTTLPTLVCKARVAADT